METITVIDQVTAVARQHGWTVDAHEGATRATRVCRRGPREYVTLGVWTRGGHVYSAAGQYATGPASIGRLDLRMSGHPLGDRDIAAVLAALASIPAAGHPNTSGYALRVSAGIYTEHHATACNYSVHNLVPGTYPIEYVSTDYQPVERSKAYYAIAYVPTVDVLSYYSHEAHRDANGSVLWTAYAYEMPDQNNTAGKGLNGHGEIVSVSE